MLLIPHQCVYFFIAVFARGTMGPATHGQIRGGLITQLVRIVLPSSALLEPPAGCSPSGQDHLVTSIPSGAIQGGIGKMDQVRAYLSGTTPVPACRWARTLPLLSGRFGHLPWRAVPGKIHAGQAAAPMARTRVMPWMLAYCQRIELLQTICVRLLHEEK